MFLYNRHKNKIIELSENDIINQFNEGEYNESRHAFYSVDDTPLEQGGYCVYKDTHYGNTTIVNTFKFFEEAQHFSALQNAIDCAETSTEDVVYIHKTKAEVLEQIQSEIDDDAAWDLDDAWDVECRDKLIDFVKNEERK